MKKNALYIVAISFIIVIVFTTLFFILNKPDYSGITLKVSSSIDLTEGAYLEGAKKFEEDFGCTVEFTDTFEGSDLSFSPWEDFAECLPLNDYVNQKNKLYTKSIIEQSCTENGNIYGISHALLGRINYCTYNPDQYGDLKLPYSYYKGGSWTWDNFIKMSDEINANIAIDWNSSYINMMYSLFRDENGNPTFDYGTQSQIEWLNFVRTLIYDKGIVDTREGAFEVGFLPQLVLDNIDQGTQMRYIPWPTKDGKLDSIFVDEYHFSVPKTAAHPELSIELANYMIKSCVDTRTALYEANMTNEDFKLFQKQLKNIYCYPPHTDYIPATEFITDFVRGKTVTEHIYNMESGAGHIN